MNRMISDEEFKERIAHLTPEAQKGALLDRQRDLDQEALKEATSGGPSGSTDWNAWALRVVTVLHERANKRIDAMRDGIQESADKIVKILGQKFREEADEIQADIDAKLADAVGTFKVTYGKGVRDLCAEYARAEARDAVRLARQEDRQTLAALERQIEAMAHEIERLKLMGK